MIKGVSRHIIEVVGDNPYFERAWFVVRPAYADGDGELLRTTAQKEFDRTDTFVSMRKRARWRRIGRVGQLLLSALVGAGITLLWLKTH